MFASPIWSLNCKCLKCGLILHAPRVKWSRCSWIKTMVNMREVINYKPDILTCCFCILVLLLDHGCQHISFPNIPHLLAQGGFGGGGPLPSRRQPYESRCPNANSRPRFFLCGTQLLLLFIIYYICVFTYYSGLVSEEHLFCAQSQNDEMRMQMHHDTFKTVINELKDCFFCWPLSATTSIQVHFYGSFFAT